LEGFWKKSASLTLLAVISVIFQIMVFPWISSDLRIDLLLCLVISLCIFCRFHYGLVFVLIMSYVLQAFSGARAGFLPFCYLGSFMLLDIIRNILFLDSIAAQMVLSFVLCIFINLSAVLFSDMLISDVRWIPVITGSILTAVICPFIIKLSRRILVNHEN
jgi:cell shape-determining protein MreD